MCVSRAEPGPPVPRAVLTARAVQKALCSAISHAASEHAARLFPGEQRRQLLPSCSTSLPHRLLVDGGEQRTPRLCTPALGRESPPRAGEHLKKGDKSRSGWAMLACAWLDQAHSRIQLRFPTTNTQDSPA